MQQIVYQMGTTKTNTILRRSLFLEGEMSCQEIVYDKAEHIANGIGNVHINPVLQYPIDGIMQRRSHNTYNTESYSFSENLFLLHICNIAAKVQKNFYNTKQSEQKGAVSSRRSTFQNTNQFVYYSRQFINYSKDSSRTPKFLRDSALMRRLASWLSKRMGSMMKSGTLKERNLSR